MLLFKLRSTYLVILKIYNVDTLFFLSVLGIVSGHYPMEASSLPSSAMPGGGVGGGGGHLNPHPHQLPHGGHPGMGNPHHGPGGMMPGGPLSQMSEAVNNIDRAAASNNMDMFQNKVRTKHLSLD